MKRTIGSLVLLMTIVWTSAQVRTALPAPRSSTVDRIFGKDIEDPYRKLEKVDDPIVKEWIVQKDSLSRAWLHYESKQAIADQLADMIGDEVIDPPQYAGENLLFLKTGHKYRKPVLVLESDNQERIIFNPTDYSGAEYDIGEFCSSPSGQLIAMTIKKTGERGETLIFIETVTGDILEDSIPNARISKFPWLNESNIVYRTSSEDRIPQIEQYDLNRSKSTRILEAAGSTSLSAEVTFDGEFILVSDGVTKRDVYLLDSENKQEPNLILNGKKTGSSYEYVGSANGEIFFSTNESASNGKVISIESKTSNEVEVVVPELEMSIDQAHLFGGKLFITYLDKAVPKAKIYELKGNLHREFDLPVGLSWSNYSFNWAGNTGSPTSNVVFHKNLGLTSGGSVYQIDITTGKMSPYHQVSSGLDGIEVTTYQVMIPIADGKEMPMFLTHRKGLKLDGNNPTLLYIYGAYGFTEIPFINAKYALFIKAGGIHAMPNVRGGGALGENWYEAGRQQNKPNTISDALSASQWLIDENYTSSSKLIIEGNSAGCIPAMAAVNQNPDLFGAAILEVPLSDMVRLLEFSGGPAWRSQFGDPSRKEDFDVIVSYSPYNNVRPANYPPIFIAPGELDQTAPLLHGCKLAARLDESQKGEAPIIMRVNWGGNHNGGDEIKRNQERTDQLVFLTRILGMDFTKVK